MLTPACDADLAAATALINSAYRSEEGWTNETDFLDGLRIDEATLRADLAASPGATLYLQREDGELRGCFWLEPKPDNVWYLGLLTVRPNQQGRKLGRELLSQAESLARGFGAKRMRITVVNIRTELVSWYQRRGYALTGATEPFPYDSTFGQAKRPDLEFVVLEKAL